MTRDPFIVSNSMTSDILSIDGLAPGLELGSLENADVEAIAFLVMLKAAEDAEADLKEIMNSISEHTKRLCRWRKLIAILETHRDAAANKDLVLSARAAIADQLSALTAMSESDALRLQAALDRRSKIVEVATTLLKAQSEAAADLVASLK